AQPSAIPPDSEWYCHVVLPESQSDPDEEWYEVTHWWEVHVRAGQIDCDEYTNLATIVSAGQTYILRANSTDEDTAGLQSRLIAWRAGLDRALHTTGVFVDVGIRPHASDHTQPAGERR